MRKPLEDVFCDNLRYYRQKAKLSQEKLSVLLDKNINYINMIEGRKSLPPIGMIEKIADELNIAPSKLFETDEAERTYFDKNEFIEKVAEMVAQDTKSILGNLL